VHAPLHRYNNKRYYLEVQEVQPQDAACIIECDCNVDFNAPVGYTEPDYTGARSKVTNGGMLNLPAPQKALSKAREEETKQQAAGVFKAFAGSGQRLDGKELKSAQSALLETMPKQPSELEKAKIWQSTGICTGTMPAHIRASSGAMSPPAPRPVFRKPTNAKWAKANKAAFTGNSNSLK
jgi:ubiquitin fusion degradation protein 1